MSLEIPSINSTPDEWRKAFGKLPESVKEAIYNQALSACPNCGPRGVPQSWAVVTAVALAKE